MQLHKFAYSYMSLHAVPWACMQLHKLACSSFLRLSSSQEFRSACLNYPKGVMGIFLVLSMSFIRGYVSSNQIHLLFGIFVQKMVKNTWKRAFKGLYWFGLAWLCLSNDPGEVLTSQNPKNCIKIAKNLTIKYHWNCLILAFSIAPFWTFWSIFFV